MPPEEDEPPPAASPPTFEIWPSHWDVWQLFTRCATQWHHAGTDGQATGLRYDAVRLVARLMKIPFTMDLLDDLQVLEDEALVIWAEQRAEALERLEAERGRR